MKQNRFTSIAIGVTWMLSNLFIYCDVRCTACVSCLSFTIWL